MNPVDRLRQPPEMFHPQMSLEGHVALVVGAGKGIGRAIAVGVAEAGADLGVIARTDRDLDDLSAEIEGLGRSSLALRADATDSSAIDAAVSAMLNRYGRIDVLVNAVGQNLRKPLTETSDAEWDDSIRANLTSMFYSCRAVGRVMIAQRQGRVINIASTAGTRGRANMSSYCASKAAVINLSRALAVEWAPYRIRVNVLCPGRFLTPATAPEMNDTAKYAAYIRNVPLGRIGQPDELKPAAVWLASAASDFATGTVLVLDGGQTLN